MSAKKKRTSGTKPEYIVKALTNKLDIELNLEDYPDNQEVWEWTFGIWCLQREKTIAYAAVN
jgi:hypothetical protein